MQELNRLLLYQCFEKLMSLTNLSFTYVGMCLDNDQSVDRDWETKYLQKK